ncbi:MAG: ankyrin repeat domain-containing protein [Treponema sp.]
MFSFHKVKKTAAALLYAVSLSACFAASDLNAYGELIKNGDADAIADALQADKKMKKAVIGDAKDSLLMAAVQYGRPESVVRLLIDSGVKLSRKNKYGQTALTYACAFSSDRSVIILIAERSGSEKSVRKQLLKKDKTGMSALDYALKNPDRAAFDIISPYLTEKDLEKAGVNADFFTPPAEPDDAEDDAPAIPDEEEAEPPKPTVPPSDENTVSAYKKTYLFDYLPAETPAAPEEAEPEEELTLIQNPDKQDKNGRTALMKAVQSGNDWEIRLLIKSGADVNMRDRDGWTALMYAVRYQNSLDAVNLLLKNGAEIQTVNKFGLSALQLAACYNANPDVLKTLLAAYPAGTNEIFKAFVLSLSSPQVNNAAQAAKTNAFIERGVPLNRFYEGKTPLMYAAEFGASTDVIQILLDNGALPAIRGANGKTAFDYASQNSLLDRDDVYWSLNAR